jgi:Na+/H+ antiporter NhaB
VLDALRIFAVVNAALLGLICFYLAANRKVGLTVDTRLRFFGVVLTTIFTCVHEGEQVGKPFIWWALPLLLLINIVFSLGIVLGARNNWRSRG